MSFGRHSSPLGGLRVIDFTNAVAGPVCTQILADMGAEVIKVESPTARSPRAHGTPLRSADLPDHPWNRLTNFNELNRGKRGLVLDAADPAGRAAFLQLAAVSDVIVENFAPRVVGNLDIAYAAVRAVRPEIIYCSMPAFGKSGPYRDRISYGPGIDAMSGLSYLTGYEDGPPMKPGNFYCDYNAALVAVVAILAALEHRDRTGEGQYLEPAMIEGELQLIGEALIDAALNGRIQHRRGNRDTSMAPHGVYECGVQRSAFGNDPPLDPLRSGRGSHEGTFLPVHPADGTDEQTVGVTGDSGSRSLQGGGRGVGHSRADSWLAIAVSSDAEWAALCGAIGRPDLIDDPRFADVVSRYHNQTAADAVIGQWTAERDHTEAMQILQAAGVAAGAALSMSELLADPHHRARGLFRTVEHPEQGPIPHTRPGFIFESMDDSPRDRLQPSHLDPGRDVAANVSHVAHRTPPTRLDAGPVGPAPRFGEHNMAVLQNLLGVAGHDYDDLVARGVVADLPRVVG